MSNSSQVVSPDLMIVTGAGRGIGRSIALSLGGSGAHVLCISQSAKSEETSTAICQLGGNADSLVLDLCDYEIVEKRVSEWIANSGHTGRIGVVLAAAVLGPSGSLQDTPIGEWEKTFKVNVLGNLSAVKAALPFMKGTRYGRILFFAGGGAAYAYPIFPAYAASKTALVRAVENLHEDLKDAGDFAVAILAPGAVETDTLTTVRKHGGYVKTTVGIEEPTGFATAFMKSTDCAFSGCFVHVRDTWPQHLNSGEALRDKNLWKLRRVE